MAVKQWEYKIVDLKEGEDVQRLNSLGTEGWELLAVFGFGSGHKTFYLKREKS